MKLILTFLFLSVMSANVYASEDLYPCNLELKSMANVTVDSASFYARAYVEDRLADPSSALRFHWITLFASEAGEWNGLFLSSEEFRYIVENVQFSPSLEKLGVSYRVGFCYLGPVSTATSVSSDDTSTGSYDLAGTISTGSSSDIVSYTGNISGYCDLRNVGTNKNARMDIELSPSFVESDMQFSISLGQFSSGEISFDYPINVQSTQVPRFCKLNIEINESEGADRPSQIDLNQAQFMLQIDKNLM